MEVPKLLLQAPPRFHIYVVSYGISTLFLIGSGSESIDGRDSGGGASRAMLACLPPQTTPTTLSSVPPPLVGEHISDEGLAMMV